jgi:hypothetical protein
MRFNIFDTTLDFYFYFVQPKKERKLKATWSPSLEEDLRNYHIMMQPIRIIENEI